MKMGIDVLEISPLVMNSHCHLCPLNQYSCLKPVRKGYNEESDLSLLNAKPPFKYAEASGQVFNFEKSSMFFSSCTQGSLKEVIKNLFQLKEVSKHEKYLGLPSMIGRKRKGFFNDVKLRVLDKISKWQHKFFSSGGKEILIKAIAQAVPTFAMSVFKIPVGICEDIQKAVAKFWWGSNKEKRGIHWTRWENLCQAKSRGGLGFREPSPFNQALVAKQGWRVMQNPESLVARILKARYFKHTDFMNAKIGSNPSFVWRSIVWGRQILENGGRWRIGNGRQVEVMKDNWIPRPSTFKPILKPDLPEKTIVAELIEAGNKWNAKLITEKFRNIDAEAILEIPLPEQPKPDQLIWHYDRKGLYSVKSGYQLASLMAHPDSFTESAETSNHWKIIWTMDIPEKIKIFLWRAARNLLPTAGNLCRRKIMHDPVCKICKAGIENISHVLISCKTAKKIWKNSPFFQNIQEAICDDFLSILERLSMQLSIALLEVVGAICWVIWQGRNKRIFEGRMEDSVGAVARAEALIDSFRRTRLLVTSSNRRVEPERAKIWEAPPMGWYKINVDAATNREKNLVGLGVVIRDWNGNPLLAAIKTVSFHGDVVFAEAEAALWGLQVAVKERFNPIIVESDAKEVVNLINNRSSNITEVEWVISEIKEVSNSILNFRCIHVSRNCNDLAHALAKLALVKINAVVWRDFFPADIMYLLHMSD